MSLEATRRRLLGCLAAALAIGGSRRAQAEAAGTDEPVLDLARRVAAAEAAWMAANDAEDDILSEYRRREPPPPEALFQTDQDRRVLWRTSNAVHGPTGRRWYGAENSLKQLREPQVNRDPLGRVVDGDPVRVANSEAQRRANGIVAAYDGWVDACNRLGDELGVAEANDRAADLLETYHEVLGELVRTPAVTLAGILAKAQIGARLFGDEPVYEDDEADHDVERIAFSVVRDLLAMQGRA